MSGTAAKQVRCGRCWGLGLVPIDADSDLHNVAPPGSRVQCDDCSGTGIVTATHRMRRSRPDITLRGCRDVLDLRYALRAAGDFITEHPDRKPRSHVVYTTDDEHFVAWWTQAGNVVCALEDAR